MAAKPTSQKILEAFAILGVTVILGGLVYLRFAESAKARRAIEAEKIAAEESVKPADSNRMTSADGTPLYPTNKSAFPPATPEQLATVKATRFRIPEFRGGGGSFGTFSDDVRFAFRRNETDSSPGAIYDFVSGAKLSDLQSPRDEFENLIVSDDGTPSSMTSHDLNKVCFSPDGKRFAAVVGRHNDVGDQRICVWETASGKLIATHFDAVFALDDPVFLDSDRLLFNVRAFAGQAFEVLHVPDRTSSLLMPYSALRQASECDFAGDLLAFVSRHELAVHSLSRNETKTLKISENGINARDLKLSTDGAKLFVTHSQEIRVYDTATGESSPLGMIPSSLSQLHRFLIPDRAAVAAGGEDGVVRCFTSSDRKIGSVIALPYQRCQLLAVSRNGKRFVMSEPDGEIVTLECTEELPPGAIDLEKIVPKKLGSTAKS